jgi:hypothetical protein
MEELENKKKLVQKLKLILKESFNECEGEDEKTASKFRKINKEAFECLKLLGN